MRDMPPEAIPHDHDMELALLAAILDDDSQLDRLERLDSKHFHDPVNRERATCAAMVIASTS
jgi:hypothetical protein